MNRRGSESGFRRRGAELSGDHSLEPVGDGLAVGFGQQQIDVVAAADLVRAVAGEALGERAEVDDGVIGPEDDDHALGGLHQVAERGLASLLGERELPAFGDPAQAGPEQVRVRAV